MAMLFVAIGGAIGSVMRYLMMVFVGHYTGNEFPYGTVIVNITGSLVMGLLIGWMARATPAHADNIRLFVAVGVLGGYTTFSTFSLDAITLMEEGKYTAMSVYIVASVACSLVGLLAGLQIVRAIA